jgi:hypothetical protein
MSAVSERLTVGQNPPVGRGVALLAGAVLDDGGPHAIALPDPLEDSGEAQVARSLDRRPSRRHRGRPSIGRRKLGAVGCSPRVGLVHQAYQRLVRTTWGKVQGLMGLVSIATQSV